MSFSSSQKERDLELAARIGQSLLEQNSELRNRLDQLENDYLTANETVSGLWLHLWP